MGSSTTKALRNSRNHRTTLPAKGSSCLTTKTAMMMVPSRRVPFWQATVLLVAALACFQPRPRLQVSFDIDKNNEQQMQRGLGCTWSLPRHDSDDDNHENDDCVNLVTRQGRAALVAQNAKAPPRWLFFGDSTMQRLVSLGSLGQSIFRDNVCSHQRHCTLRDAGRCTNYQLFRITTDPAAAGHWRPPLASLAEGPIGYGLKNHSCQDCSGCTSRVLECQPIIAVNGTASETCRYSYGGYFSVEFARDVETQSDRYDTTQENAAAYINEYFNTKHLVDIYGRPICVVSTGHHDAIIANITVQSYLTNVAWYLKLLSTTCSHIVWLTNNAPQTDDYIQTKASTKEWNLAVHDLLHDLQATRAVPRGFFSFVDVYKASLSAGYHNNLHMDNSWYRALGATFVTMIKRLEEMEW